MRLNLSLFSVCTTRLLDAYVTVLTLARLVSHHCTCDPDNEPRQEEASNTDSNYSWDSTRLFAGVLRDSGRSSWGQSAFDACSIGFHGTNDLSGRCSSYQVCRSFGSSLGGRDSISKVTDPVQASA